MPASSGRRAIPGGGYPDPHRPEQEQHPHQDQHDWSGDRTMRRTRNWRRSRRHHWASHGSPHLWAERTRSRRFWRYRRNRTSGRVRARPRRQNVSFSRGASLQQFDSANHQQNYRPGAVKAQARLVQVLQQEQAADSKQQRRTHDPPGAAARALAARTTRRQQAPIAGEQPGTERDQNQRPEAVKAESEAHGMQQEEHAEQDEHDRAHRDIAGSRSWLRRQRLPPGRRDPVAAAPSGLPSPSVPNR